MCVTADFSAPFLRSLRLLTDRLDVVAIGVEDERRVVVRAIAVADPGTTVVPASRLQRRLVEGLHHRAIAGREGDVQRRLVRPALRDPEGRAVLGSESSPPLGLI